MKSKTRKTLLSIVSILVLLLAIPWSGAQNPTTNGPVKPKTQDRVVRPAAIVNVKDHGVKGDGVTDDHAAVQKAVDAAPKGSTIHFPEGIYYFASGVRPKKRTHLVFTGDPGAVIKAKGGKSAF